VACSDGDRFLASWIDNRADTRVGFITVHLCTFLVLVGFRAVYFRLLCFEALCFSALCA
jgi:hypothetical protein